MVKYLIAALMLILAGAASAQPYPQGVEGMQEGHPRYDNYCRDDTSRYWEMRGGCVSTHGRDQSACRGDPNCIVRETGDPILQGRTGITYFTNRGPVSYLDLNAWRFRPDCARYIGEHEAYHRANPNADERTVDYYAPGYNCGSLGVQRNGGQLQTPRVPW